MFISSLEMNRLLKREACPAVSALAGEHFVCERKSNRSAGRFSVVFVPGAAAVTGKFRYGRTLRSWTRVRNADSDVHAGVPEMQVERLFNRESGRLLSGLAAAENRRISSVFFISFEFLTTGSAYCGREDAWDAFPVQENRCVSRCVRMPCPAVGPCRCTLGIYTIIM